MHPVVGLLGGYVVAAFAAGVFSQKVAEMVKEDISHNVQGVTFRRALRAGIVFGNHEAIRQKVAEVAEKVSRRK